MHKKVFAIENIEHNQCVWTYVAEFAGREILTHESRKCTTCPCEAAIMHLFYPTVLLILYLIHSFIFRFLDDAWSSLRESLSVT
jgi:hypothetical protein